MRKYNITLYKPNLPCFDSLNSYLEVIESLRWGFNAIGIECSFRLNEVDRSRTNIVFGWIVAANQGALDSFPSDSIMYNCEQLSTRDFTAPEWQPVTQRFQIWDYSLANIRQWEKANPRHRPFYAPISYAPTLTRIAPPSEEDLDILFIGSMGPSRHKKISQIGTVYSSSPSLNSPSVVTLRNVWGEKRDEFIGRAKLLLNVSEDLPHAQIFEIVRVSYYLANRKAVVCELAAQNEIEDDARASLLFVPADKLSENCDLLLADPKRRAEVAERGFEMFTRRDVREVIKRWVS